MLSALFAVSPSLSASLAHGEPAKTPGGAKRAGAKQEDASSNDRRGDAGGLRYVGETPDATIEAEVRRAIATESEADAMAALSVLASVAHRASEGVAERAVRELATNAKIPAEVRGEASVLARALASDEGTAAGVSRARDLGILTDVAVLGPFRDTGGGLDAHDGPEAPSAHPAETFTDPKKGYSWGTIQVTWRSTPASFAQARGVPLDLFVHPRRESCTIVASKLHVDAKTPMIVRLAAAGQARLVFDGVEAGKSDDVHELGSFDRLAARVDASPGTHLVYAKVCSGALEDEGRVRLRITGENDAPLRVQASSDLALKPGESIAWAKAVVEKRSTPLVRTAGVTGTKGKPARPGDALLDAAIVRTLGGADDLKSPRAPGQLDALLQDSALDADRMAMAASISSGANKSGRLYRAKNRAEGTNDGATISFASRELVALHLGTSMPDWAMATLRSEKLDQKTDPDAVRLGARTLRALGVEALSIDAFHRLAKAFRAAPKTVPDALLFDLASLAQVHDARIWGEVATELARRGIRGGVLVDAMTARGKEEVARAAVDAFEGGMEDADEAVSVADTVAEAGAHDLAARLYFSLAGVAPNKAEVWTGLARELAAAKNDPEAPRKVVYALERARQLAPSDARTRAELALRNPTPAAQTAQGTESSDDERWLTPIQTILARRQGVPPGNTPPEVADRELHWLRVVRMHEDNRVSQLLQYAREIVIPPRTQEELYEPIPPEGDLTEILRARVHKKNGNVVFPTEEHNDGMRPSIRWPELDPGDTVEVVLRQWTSTAIGGRGDAPFYFMDYAGSPASHPLLYNEVVIETLPGHPPLYVDVLHDKRVPYKRIEKDLNGRHVLQLVWDKPLTLPEEPLAPQLTETAPVIVGSTFETWADFRKWYAEAVRGFTEPDDEVRRIAKDLTKGKASKEDKLRAIFDFVADDIRYVNYVSGESWLPNRPQQLLARREGDCDDKALLLITLLRAIGIEAQEVMVQTRLTGQPSVLLAKHAAVPMFDHGIAFLPGSTADGGRYLDATSPQSRLGPIPSMDARGYALRMEGPAEIVQLPKSSPADHGSDVTWSVTLDEGGGGELVGEERHSGDSAFWLRTNLSQAEARPQYVEDMLVGPWLPTSEVDKNIGFEGDTKNGQAIVKYKAKSRGLARREGNDRVISLSSSATYGSSLAPLPTRTLPVQLPSYLAPSHQSRTLRITAPQGFSWGELPPGGDATGPTGTAFGRAHLEVKRDPKNPRVLLIERSVVFDQDRIEVDQYPAWRAWIQQVDALLHKEVRLVPSGEKK